MRFKIALIVLGSLLLASGIFFVGIKLKPSSNKPSGITVANEATKSVGLKKEAPKEEKSKEAVKGTTSQAVKPIVNYQPTPESQAITEKLTEAAKSVEKPAEPAAPDIPEPSPSDSDELPFSLQHL